MEKCSVSKGAFTLCCVAECNSQFDCVHIKKEIFADYTSGYKNCGRRPVNFIWFFSLSGWCHFETSHSSYATRQTFDETDILPTKFLCCRARRNMQKPCLSRAALTSTLFSPFAALQAMFCCILLRGIVWAHLNIEGFFLRNSQFCSPFNYGDR